MTSSKLPEGFEICPHCEGDKALFYEGQEQFKKSCPLCCGTGIVDWVSRAINKPRQKREYPLSYMEQKQKVDEFRKRMKERIKNDKSKSRR